MNVGFNKEGQPDTENTSKLANFLGTIARNGLKAPLTYTDWRLMPQLYKDDMWATIKAKANVTDSDYRWIFKSLSKKWKDWKSELKEKYYDPYKTDEDRLNAKIDNRVQDAQWPILVKFWSSEVGKNRCKKNKKNRLKQKLKHIAGSRSFARIRREMKEKRPDGKDPSRVEVFLETHTPKDGNVVDEPSANIIAEFHEKISKLPPGSEDKAAKDDIFAQVMGEDGHGHVRTYGLGPSPSDLWGPKPNRHTSTRLAYEAVNAAEERASKMQEQMVMMQQKHDEEVVEMQKKYDNMEAKYAGLEAQVALLMSHMSSNSTSNAPTMQVNSPSLDLAKSKERHDSPQLTHPTQSTHPTKSKERHDSPQSTHLTKSKEVHPKKKTKTNNMTISWTQSAFDEFQNAYTFCGIRQHCI